MGEMATNLALAETAMRKKASNESYSCRHREERCREVNDRNGREIRILIG